MKVICIKELDPIGNSATGLAIPPEDAKIYIGECYTVTEEVDWFGLGKRWKLAEKSPNYAYHKKYFALISEIDETGIHEQYQKLNLQ